MGKAKAQQKEYYDIPPSAETLINGERVWLKHTTGGKLDNRWMPEPYIETDIP